MTFIEIKNLKIHYPIRGGIFNTIQDYVYAVDGVDLVLEAGKTYGLVGESGSGKSTIGKALVGLEPITSGQILYQGEDVTKKTRKRSGKAGDYNRQVQMIFQDSGSALNPQKTILQILSEPMDNFFNYSRQETRKRAIELLEIVGMTESALSRYPHEFSGGQRQRIGVARAVASQPQLIIADEPTSALDLSVQAQVLNFMNDIQQELGIAYLFISHDLSVVRYMASDIAVMHRGRFVEQGDMDKVYQDPQHIYTQRLLAAIPHMNPNIRQQLKNKRHQVNAHYEDQAVAYYDEKGRVYDLMTYQPGHKVALKPERGK